MDGFLWFIAGLVVGGLATMLIIAAYIAGLEQDLGHSDKDKE